MVGRLESSTRDQNSTFVKGQGNVARNSLLEKQEQEKKGGQTDKS